MTLAYRGLPDSDFSPGPKGSGFFLQFTSSGHYCSFCLRCVILTRLARKVDSYVDVIHMNDSPLDTRASQNLQPIVLIVKIVLGVTFSQTKKLHFSKLRC